MITRTYNLNGYAGLVERRRNRRTGTLVGLYHAHQAGIDADPETPWVTVCEDHGSTISHQTLALARSGMVAPDDWCDECADPDPIVGYEVFIYWAEAVSLNPVSPVVSLGPDRWRAVNLGAQVFHTTSSDINLRQIHRSERDRLRAQ